jgi:hypothetical protein
MYAALKNYAAPKAFRPIWLRFWVTMLVIVSILVTLWLSHIYHSQQELEAALAELDTLDPGWRFVDIQSQREVAPADATPTAHDIAHAAQKEFPKLPWPFWPFPEYDGDKRIAALARRAISRSFNDTTRLFNDEQVRVLKHELARGSASLELLRRLPGLATGSMTKTENGWVTAVGDCHSMCELLDYDARFCAHNGDLDGAMANIHAMLALARVAGREPSLRAQLDRLWLDRVFVVGTLRRLLALGEAKELNLATIQHELEAEADTPFLVIGLRGERAFTDWALEQTQKRALSLAEASQMYQYQYGHWLVHCFAQGRAGRLREFLEVRAARAGLLKAWTPLIELARQEPAERLRTLPAKGLRKLAPAEWSNLLIGPLPELYEYLRREAEDRRSLWVAACALAAERYRMACGVWPSELAELVPQFLPSVPTVLAESATTWPLRVGTSLRIGDFMLHDVAQRRQPAKPWDFSPDKAVAIAPSREKQP